MSLNLLGVLALLYKYLEQLLPPINSSKGGTRVHQNLHNEYSLLKLDIIHSPYRLI